MNKFIKSDEFTNSVRNLIMIKVYTVCGIQYAKPKVITVIQENERLTDYEAGCKTGEPIAYQKHLAIFYLIVGMIVICVITFIRKFQTLKLRDLISFNDRRRHKRTRALA